MATPVFTVWQGNKIGVLWIDGKHTLEKPVMSVQEISKLAYSPIVLEVWEAEELNKVANRTGGLVGVTLSQAKATVTEILERKARAAALRAQAQALIAEADGIDRPATP